ncbi:MAG TPA: hypothetical protein VF114_01010 [Candidatus Limnocylindria bacterium]
MTAISRTTAATAVIAIALLASCQLGGAGPSTGDASPSASFMDAGSLEPTVSSEPSASLPAGCVNPPNDILDLIEAQQSPEADVVACYGDEPITFDAQWMDPGIADCPTAPEPAWLACAPHFLRPVGATGKVGVPELGVAVDPSITSFPEAGTTVRVTGHFDDARAETCHDTFVLPDASPEPAEQIIERCTRAFVITALEEPAP